jgi:alkylhydroperoxidase/carboxymuconolactone decarboxylase family protein YurZ
LGGNKEQIVEIILQMLFYAGGANTSNALAVAKEVFIERKLLEAIETSYSENLKETKI